MAYRCVSLGIDCCVVYTVKSCNSGQKLHLMLHEIPVLLMLDVKLHVSFLIRYDLWYVLARVLLHVPECM